MSDNQAQAEMNKAMFINLVMMLATTAMQQMGKLKNPMTDKVEVELEQAQATIDMLTMLEAKTRGNRDKDEDRLFKDTLSSLQMTYVDTVRKTPPPATPGKAEKPAEPAAAPAEPQAPATPASTPADDKTKYHKSYGG